ncbi:LAFA_0B04984g1_1 [Lachancea sp. 'fantastica']|nr:LAFA_0B04984g1_1 [Lachancea sp. 'fantastica']
MSFRDALKVYILNPADYPEDVVFHDDDVVIIQDRFPKSQCHYLVLTRNLSESKKRPWALSPELKLKLQPYIDRASNHVFESFIKEFKWKGTKVAPFENKSQFHNKNYFIENFTQVGVHSVPSLNNLHIHVMTKDFHSDRLKHKKHYNSFNTEFFVPWDKLPLESVDAKFMEETVLKKRDLKCCYCNENFKNRFSQLKLHLDHEFTKRFARCSM